MWADLLEGSDKLSRDAFVHVKVFTSLVLFMLNYNRL